MPANTLLYLWPQRTFYLGELDGAVHLQLAASVLLFALDAPLLARCGSHSLRASSLLLPVGEKVVIEGGGRIALCYLDVLAKLRERTDLPVAAYNVSGEYSMLIAAAERGWGDLGGMARESLMAIDRAGADLLLSYWAPRYRELFCP